MFLIHIGKKDLRKFCHNSRVAAHKTELIASKRPREASLVANKSSSHFSIFYLHIYAVLFPPSHLSPSHFLKVTRQTIHFCDAYKTPKEHITRSREFLSSAKLQAQGVRSDSWMNKKRNRSHNEILRGTLKFQERRRFVSRRGYADFTRIWKEAKGVAFAESHLPRARWPLTDLARQDFKGDQETISNALGMKWTLFPSWEKFIVFGNNRNDRLGLICFESVKRKNVSSSLSNSRSSDKDVKIDIHSKLSEPHKNNEKTVQ